MTTGDDNEGLRLFDFGKLFPAPGWMQPETPRTEEEERAFWEDIERQREAAARQEVDEKWKRAVPDRYRWAHEGAQELAGRCFPVGGLPKAVAQLRRALMARQSLALVGPPGSGKSTLAVVGLRIAFERGDKVAFISTHKLGSARIQHPAGHGEAPLVERAMTVPLLVLDDLGNERQTQTNAVPDVLFERHEAGLQTWITTGDTGEQLQGKYGGGIVRRVFEQAAVIRCEQPKREGAA